MVKTGKMDISQWYDDHRLYSGPASQRPAVGRVLRSAVGQAVDQGLASGGAVGWLVLVDGHLCWGFCESGLPE